MPAGLQTARSGWMSLGASLPAALGSAERAAHVATARLGVDYATAMMAAGLLGGVVLCGAVQYLLRCTRRSPRFAEHGKTRFARLDAHGVADAEPWDHDDSDGDDYGDDGLSDGVDERTSTKRGQRSVSRIASDQAQAQPRGGLDWD